MQENRTVHRVVEVSDFLRKDRLKAKYNPMECFRLACSFKNTIEKTGRCYISGLVNMVKTDKMLAKTAPLELISA